MNHLELRPEETRWLRRWIRSNLVCVCAICGFLILIRFQSDVPYDADALAGPGSHVDAEPLNDPLSSLPELADPSFKPDALPPQSELVLLPHHRPNGVPPKGWRRTSNGWEHVSTWRSAARPLGEIVMEQEAREPFWIRTGLARLRRVPPLAFALLQIAAISAIVGVSRTEHREELETVSVGG